MIKKTFLIIVLLFLMVSTKALSAFDISTSFQEFASQQEPAPTIEIAKDDAIPFQSYLLPIGTAVLMIGGIAFYWLVFRKKITQQ